MTTSAEILADMPASHQPIAYNYVLVTGTGQYVVVTKLAGAKGPALHVHFTTALNEATIFTGYEERTLYRHHRNLSGKLVRLPAEEVTARSVLLKLPEHRPFIATPEEVAAEVAKFAEFDAQEKAEQEKATTVS
jgi:hypothetical protein